MIEESKRTATISKFVAGTEEYSKLLSLKKEMEAQIIDSINSTYSENELKIAQKYSSSVIYQGDIDLEYDLGISWGYRKYFKNISTIEVSNIKKPAVVLRDEEITNEGEKSELWKVNKDLYTELHRIYKEMADKCKVLCKKIEALDEVLSEKSMNITSIKKYYPELYNLMTK